MKKCCNTDCNQGRDCPYRGTLTMSEGNKQWALGVLVGIVLTSLVWAATHRINKDHPKEHILPKSIVEAYNMGHKDALRTNPVSAELDQVCVNLWAGKQ